MRRAASRSRRIPDVPRSADGSALEPADGWCRSSALQDLSTVGCGSEHSRCRWLPHVGEGAARYSACSTCLPFPGEMAERTGDDCHGIERFTSRRAQAWPLGKGSAVGKTRSTGMRAQGEPLDRQAAAASSQAGAANRREPMGRLPVLLVLAAHNCPSKSATASTKQKVRVRRYACKRVIRRHRETSRPTICNL